MKILSIFSYLFLASTFFVACNDQSRAEVEGRINRSEVLTRLNGICENIPKPGGFKLIDKQIRGNARKSVVAFDYKLDGSSDEANRFFEKWFSENGWTRDSSLGERFNKSTDTVTLENNVTGSADFAISCSHASE